MRKEENSREKICVGERDGGARGDWRVGGGEAWRSVEGGGAELGAQGNGSEKKKSKRLQWGTLNDRSKTDFNVEKEPRKKISDGGRREV